MDDVAKSNSVGEKENSKPKHLFIEPSPPQTETTSLIEKADNVAKRMEAANKKTEELLERQEAVAARLLLSGRAEAGAETKTPEQTTEEKVKADVDAALKRYR